ncbi:hypothetical protein TNCV_832171 [Trichonephila clavipes]|nr:hypothetical protein TNCV_832171 [Trichonephila clavipes]
MHKEEKSFVKEKKRKEKLAASPVEKVTKKNPRKIVKIQVLLPNLHQSTHERISSMEKKHCKILLMSSLRDGNAIETLLMTAQINTDFVTLCRQLQDPQSRVCCSL